MRFYIFFIIVSFNIPTTIFCQPSGQVSDLITRMKSENDTARVNTLNEIVSIYGNKGLFDSCEYYLAKALELSVKNNFYKGMCAAYNGLGINKMVKGEYQSALEIYFKGLAIAESNNQLHFATVIKRNIATVYMYESKYSSAIPFLQSVLAVVNKKKDSLKIFPILIEIGFCYVQQKMEDSAVFYYNKGLIICNGINFSSLREDTADQYIQAKASSLPKIANFYLGINKPAKAISLLLPFWEQIKGTKNKYNQLSLLISIDESYLKIKDFGNVIRYADIGIELDTKKEFPDGLQSLFLMKAEALYKLGKFKEAYENHLLYSALNDTVYNSEKFKAITEMQVKYDTEKKELKINSLNKEKKTQKLIVWLTGAGLLVTLGLLVFVIRSNRLRQKLLIKEKEIQKKELEHKMEGLEQTALRAQMNPHFIFNCLNSVQRFIISNDAEGANYYLSTFAKLIRQTLENSGKQLILIEAEIKYLETYIKMEQLRSNNSFDYSINVSPGIDQSGTYIPNMIIQPYVENSIHHGMLNTKDKKGLIRLDILKGDKLTVIVDDNGDGIKSKKTAYRHEEDHKSMGGAITEKRIGMYNSINEDKIELEIVDKSDFENEGTGTRVIFKFPLNN